MGGDDNQVAYNSRFGDAVRKALAGRSYRQIAPRVGVSPTYIGDMVMGKVPRREVVERLAEATGADADELLRAAGILADYDPDKAWAEGIRLINEEFGGKVEIVALGFEEIPDRDWTEAQVAVALGRIRSKAQQLAAAKERSGDSERVPSEKGRKGGGLLSAAVAAALLAAV